MTQKEKQRRKSVREDKTSPAADSARILSGDSGTRKSRWSAYYAASLISLITFLAYLPSIGNNFQRWDDGTYVVNNPFIRSLNADFFRWAFFDFYAANWHPFTWISHALDYAVWGMNPVGHHLTNNILHAMNTFLVVVLVAKLIKSAFHDSRITIDGSRFPLIAAAMTGLLFGMHPIHVESVAWTAERKDLLCALFFLLSVIAYVKYAAHCAEGMKSEHRARALSALMPGPLLSALCFFILALMSKPMAVSLPAVLLILDWYPFERIRSLKTFRTAVVEKIPFIVLSVGSSVLTLLAQKAGGAMEPLAAVPLSTRVLVAARSLIAYVGKMIAPLKLVPFYPYPKEAAFLSAGYLFAVICLVGVTAICVLAAKRQKLWIAIWAYYVITLLPVLGIIQVGSQSMADRYTYLPSLGPFIIAGVVAGWSLSRGKGVGKAQIRIVTVICVLLFASLSYLTSRQIAVWKNDFSLWDYVVQEDPEGTPMAYHNRGSLLQEMGRLDEAIEQYQIALRIWPNDWEARLNLAAAYGAKGWGEKAVEQLGIAVRLRPDSPEVYHNLGNAFAITGSSDKAIEAWQHAVQLMPDFVDAHGNLGKAYEQQGLIDKALAEYETVARLRPDHDEAYYLMSRIYANSNRMDDAIQSLRTASGLRPDNASYHNTLGVLYGQKGLYDEAVAQFDAAIRLAPDNPSYRANREKAIDMKK